MNNAKFVVPLLVFAVLLYLARDRIGEAYSMVREALPSRGDGLEPEPGELEAWEDLKAKREYRPAAATTGDAGPDADEASKALAAIEEFDRRTAERTPGMDADEALRTAIREAVRDYRLGMDRIRRGR